MQMSIYNSWMDYANIQMLIATSHFKTCFMLPFFGHRSQRSRFQSSVINRALSIFSLSTLISSPLQTQTQENPIKTDFCSSVQVKCQNKTAKITRTLNRSWVDISRKFVNCCFEPIHLAEIKHLKWFKLWDSTYCPAKTFRRYCTVCEELQQVAGWHQAPPSVYTYLW